MLDLAMRHEEELKDKFSKILLDENYMYYFPFSYREIPTIQDITFAEHQFVSVNNSGEVVGYLAYSIDRDASVVHNLNIINFNLGSLSKCFGRDLDQMFRDIFMKFNFRKLRFNVQVGNPAESFYDKYLHKIGGRVIGIMKEEDKIMNGTYCDRKMYEVFREDFIESEYNKNKLNKRGNV